MRQKFFVAIVGILVLALQVTQETEKACIFRLSLIKLRHIVDAEVSLAPCARHIEGVAARVDDTLCGNVDSRLWGDVVSVFEAHMAGAKEIRQWL